MQMTKKRKSKNNNFLSCSKLEFFSLLFEEIDNTCIQQIKELKEKIEKKEENQNFQNI